jgi:hypothetical protein
MKTRFFLPLVFVVIGCHSTGTREMASLNPKQAQAVARELTNNQAYALYGTRPFWDGAPARLIDGKWIWKDLRACGHGDIEASVILKPDGSAQSVGVFFLDSRN